MLSREWRCSWSSTDRRCSNYIWVINNFIACSGASSYIRGFTVDTPYYIHEGVISGGCFTKISRALQNILLKFAHCRNRTSFENSKLKFCTCAQSHALGIHWLWAHIQSFSLKFSPYMLIVILYFFARLFWGAREMLLKQSPGVFRESKVWFLVRCCYCSAVYNVVINLNALYSAAEIRSPGRPLKRFSYRLADVFAESLEARC